MPTDENNLQTPPITGQPGATVTNPSDGSTLYYSLLKVEPVKREQLLHLLTLCKTLAGTLHDVSDVAIAEKKLHWWHEEIERLYHRAETDTARHPATIAVDELIASHAINAEYWYDILRSNNDEKFINAPDDDTFKTRLTKDYGARIAICCQILNNLHLPAPRDWAIGLGLFDRLAQFRSLYNRGYPVLPDSDFTAAGIEPSDILKSDKHDAVAQLFKLRISDAHMHLQRALNHPELDDNICDDMLPFVTLASLRSKQLSAWLKQDVRPSERYVTLTPLRKAWLSYRSRASRRRT